MKKYGLPTQRELAKSTNFLNKSIREPVPAKKRKEVLKNAKGKCQYSGCTIKEGGHIKLQIHHKNMINSNNRTSNLMALCGTHHGVMHKKYKIKHKKGLMGERISSKIVKVKPKKKTTKKKKPSSLFGNWGK